MKSAQSIIIITALAWIGGSQAMAIEEAAYEVVKQAGRFEIRDYAPQLLAETLMDGTLEDAGNQAFDRLFRYISGENRAKAKIEMTAPVSQQARGEKIAMTAPVGQQPAGDGWAVHFMMPSSYTLETLPEPTNPDVRLRSVPERRVAAVRYSGFWSEERYRKYLSKLETWMAEEGLTPTGDPIWARYNAPFIPWFLRRNEILIPLAQD